VAEARAAWPDKFLWLHPAPHWFHSGGAELAEGVRQMVRERAQAGIADDQ